MTVRTFRPRQVGRRCLLLALIVAAATFCSLALREDQRALALTSGPLSPAAQGADSAWIPNTGTQLSAVSQTSCGAGDGSWVIATYRGSTSFFVPMSALPVAVISSISVTVCFADNDNLNNLEGIRPFVRHSGLPAQIGSVIDANGDVSPRAVTQTFPANLFRNDEEDDFEIGLTDVGFLAQSTTRVYALWASVEYEEVPPPGLTTAVDWSSAPHFPVEPLDEFIWFVSVSPPPLMADWHRTLVLWWPADLLDAVVAEWPLGCESTIPGLGRCEFSDGNTPRTELRMLVRGTASGCRAKLSVLAGYPDVAASGN